MHWFILGCLWSISLCASTLQLGIDRIFQDPIFVKQIKKQRVGLITNHTGVNAKGKHCIDQIQEVLGSQLVALFSPEHGLQGRGYAGEEINSDSKGEIPIYSLHGAYRRPTEQMLKGIDLLLYDIQDVGIRAYTFISTLFYVMEEAAKQKIKVVVLDRPNPMSGIVVDGPFLEEKWRSFIGYINIPYCHGMTIGELACYFNQEYQVGCDLSVVKMEGWNREMIFSETNLMWIPTSPNVPESDTPFYMATTGLLGELGIVNIGIGYTLPFKIVGAPWIQAKPFAQFLNQQKLKGVLFEPFYFRPFYGAYKGEDCEGVLIRITDYLVYKPLEAYSILLGGIKGLYSTHVKKLLKKVSKNKQDLFCKASGSALNWDLLQKNRPFSWKLIEECRIDSQKFLQKRKKYLFSEYQ